MGQKTFVNDTAVRVGHLKKKKTNPVTVASVVTDNMREGSAERLVKNRKILN